MDTIPPGIVLDDLPGPKRGESPALYFRDEIVWAPSRRYFALAYTISEASMMNEIGCILWASFNGHTAEILRNPKLLYACCWKSPWCIWLDEETFVFKVQSSDGKTRFTPLVVINVTKGYTVLQHTNNVDSWPTQVKTCSGPFESVVTQKLIDAIQIAVE
jgi:hypothetical protein